MPQVAYLPDCIWSNHERFDDTALIVDNGVVVKLLAASELPKDIPVTRLPDCAIIPGFVNTHTHSFQSLLKGVCDDADFFTWRDQALYKFSKNITPDELYIGALFAFSEMLLAGVTTVCDFFYINAQGNDNARQIIRAAQELGIRFVLARTFYDWDGAPECFQDSIDEAVANTEALMQEFKNDPMVSIIPAPHSLHGASKELIIAAAECGKRNQTPYHMHIAEGEYERNMMLEKYGKSPMQLLADWDVMSDQLTGIHCVWVDEADIQLMAERNMTVSYNPASNMFLGDGITPIRKLLDAGIQIGLGTDGGCSNNRASIIDEMRTCALLQKVAACDGTVISTKDVLTMGTTNGERILGQPIGQLKPGYAADFNVIHLNDLSMQPRPFWTKQLVYAMQPSAIHSTYVAGRCVMQNGQLLTVEQAKTVEKIQDVWQRWGSL